MSCPCFAVAAVLLPSDGPLAVEKDASYITALIERNNSVILLQWYHENVIVMLNSYTPTLSKRMLSFSLNLLLFCRLSLTLFFPFSTPSPILLSPPSLPPCNLLLCISIQVAFRSSLLMSSHFPPRLASHTDIHFLPLS